MEDEGMPQKKHKPGEIVAKLRQVDVLIPGGFSDIGRMRKRMDFRLVLGAAAQMGLLAR
jgi:hypothetical protein